MRRRFYGSPPINFNPLHPAPTLPKPHCPSKIAITLASPRKRGGGTAVDVFRYAVQYSDNPAFTILKLFLAVTVGIAPPSAPSMRFSALSHSLFVGRGACPSRCTEPFHPHNHCKSTTIPRKSPSPLPLYECSVCFASLQLRSFRSLHRAATLCDRYRASLHVYERSVGFASCKASGRSFYKASVPYPHSASSPPAPKKQDYACL